MVFVGMMFHRDIPVEGSVSEVCEMFESQWEAETVLVERRYDPTSAPVAAIEPASEGHYRRAGTVWRRFRQVDEGTRIILWEWDEDGVLSLDDPSMLVRFNQYSVESVPWDQLLSQAWVPAGLRHDPVPVLS